MLSRKIKDKTGYGGTLLSRKIKDKTGYGGTLLSRKVKDKTGYGGTLLSRKVKDKDWVWRYIVVLLLVSFYQCSYTLLSRIVNDMDSFANSQI